MGEIDLLIAENFASSDHNQERRQSAQCRLHDRADQGVGE